MTDLVAYLRRVGPQTTAQIAAAHGSTAYDMRKRLYALREAGYLLGGESRWLVLDPYFRGWNAGPHEPNPYSPGTPAHAEWAQARSDRQ